MNKMTIYNIFPGNPRIVIEPARMEREWMESNNRFAYKCLPLTIANQHGWVMYAKDTVYAEWDGGNGVESVRTASKSKIAGSHFGNGILTFTTDYIFELPEGYSLFISGPPNSPKNWIYPLTGVYEADWAPYSFTMNWMFTEAHRTVVFEANEPFCFVFPVQRSLIESFEVERKPLDENKELKDMYESWGKSRTAFNNDKSRDPSEWQKHYFRGLYPDGSKCPYDHKTKLKLE